MRQTRSYYFFAILALPMFIAIRSPEAVESFHNFSLSLMQPVLRAGSSAVQATGDIKEQAGIFWRTFQNNGEARERIELLESQILEVAEIKRENLRLKSLLSLKESISGKAFAAHVIGWDPSIIRKAIILDKGKSEKIKKDMPVLSSGGLLGRVLEAGSHTSKVLLLSDPDSRVGAITTVNRTQGIVAGNGSSVLEMRYLDLDSGAAVGEEVLTSGTSGLFPKGLRIGKIIGVERSLDGLHLTAKVEAEAQLSKLEEVLCLDFSPRK